MTDNATKNNNWRDATTIDNMKMGFPILRTYWFYKYFLVIMWLIITRIFVCLLYCHVVNERNYVDPLF
jgi:hypothetical protein